MRFSLALLMLFSAFGCDDGGGGGFPPGFPGAGGGGNTTTKQGSPKFDTPAGWSRSTRTAGGKRLLVAKSPLRPLMTFRPNVNVVTEPSSLSLNAYADANVRTIERQIPRARQVSRSQFSTSSGVRCIRIVYNTRMLRRDLRQIFYAFDNGSIKYVMTASCARIDGRKYESTFDGIARSFRIE